MSRKDTDGLVNVYHIGAEVALDEYDSRDSADALKSSACLPTAEVFDLLFGH